MTARLLMAPLFAYALIIASAKLTPALTPITRCDLNLRILMMRDRGLIYRTVRVTEQDNPPKVVIEYEKRDKLRAPVGRSVGSCEFDRSRRRKRPSALA
ncbi:hypothetical protein [Mesorhizobium sp.]|uniref:hypothetical protein n=1 Tax=Mesorhizobium sp. TaxID=1871066 RepID=UPI000FE54E26|nr:hypothetical protein [Mesorhizobium sp.]RWE78120.1 MAG: hypothetical protein EOS42_06235 [Mesorhizobium sp.]TIV32541.1 MAG: hypothetical protein E5V90_02610 [Mesorhizobium sp.]